MKKQPVTRNYKFSDAFLKQKCDTVATSMTRDLTEFTEREVTAVEITAFENQSTAFGDIRSDEEFEGDITGLVETKDETAENLRTSIRRIRTSAENKWGTGKARYRIYKFDDMNQLSDKELVVLGKRVGRVAQSQIGDLAGIDAAFITAHNLLVTTLDKDIDNISDSEEDRDIATEDRAEEGNALYALLVKYTNFGKDIWFSVNEAKYNDYIIYDTPSGGPEPPPGP